jgi:ABC-type cobalt transport system substrate-binding protein
VLSFSVITDDLTLLSKDQNVFCIVNCKEDYDHLTLACKPIFQKINTLYEKASIEVEEKLFDLDILMGGDIIALIFINFKSANIILNCYSKSPMLKVNTTDLIDI